MEYIFFFGLVALWHWALLNSCFKCFQKTVRGHNQILRLKVKQSKSFKNQSQLNVFSVENITEVYKPEMSVTYKASMWNFNYILVETSTVINYHMAKARGLLLKCAVPLLSVFQFSGWNTGELMSRCTWYANVSCTQLFWAWQIICPIIYIDTGYQLKVFLCNSACRSLNKGDEISCA